MGRPVTFKNSIAYYHGPGKETFYIDNPLTVTVKDDGHNVRLIGYIEPKGGPTGPDLVLFKYDRNTTSLLPNPSDGVKGQPESQVIFPSTNGSAFDTTNPVNPLTGDGYRDPAGERILVGYQYTNSTK